MQMLDTIMKHIRTGKHNSSHLYNVSETALHKSGTAVQGSVRRTKDVRSLARQAHEVAPNLIITGLGGFPDLGHHSLPLLLELGVNQADAHVLCHLVHWNELSCDWGHHNLAGLLCSCPAHIIEFCRCVMVFLLTW